MDCQSVLKKAAKIKKLPKRFLEVLIHQPPLKLFCYLEGTFLRQTFSVEKDPIEQTQICAEGCEEDDVTNFFWIYCKHKLCGFKQGSVRPNRDKHLPHRIKQGPAGLNRVK